MRKLILLILLFLPSAVLAQTNTFCPQNVNCTYTGNNTHSGTETFTGIISIATLDGMPVLDGNKYPCTGAGLASAIAAIPAGGGIIHADFCPASTFTLTSNPFTGLNQTIVFYGPCASTIQWDATSLFVDFPSNFQLIGCNTTLLNSTAQSASLFGQDTNGLQTGEYGMVFPRIYATTGTISTGTATLTVASSANINVGSVCGVYGARGAETGQTTTVNQGGGMLIGDTSVIVTATNVGAAAGWLNSTFQGNYLLVDSEIMSYGGIDATHFTSLSRGLFGTAAATHTNGSTISAVGLLISDVLTKSGNVLTLLDNATFSVTNAIVECGAQNVKIDGSVIIDNNYIVRTSPPSPGNGLLYGVAAYLAEKLYIGPNVVIQNSASGGVILPGTRRSTILAGFQHIGRPLAVPGTGSDIWCFQSCVGNRFNTAFHRDGDYAVFDDDRSNGYTRWVGPSNYNTYDLGPQHGPAYIGSMIIEGSSGNLARIPRWNCTGTASQGCLFMDPSVGQWTGTAPSPTNNTVYYGAINSTTNSVVVSSTAGATNNFILGGFTTPAPVISAAAQDLLLYQDSASGRFLSAGKFPAGNAFNWVMQRSAGAAGFPDITGTGTTALVLGDANGVKIDAGPLMPSAVNVNDLGTAALPWRKLIIGTAATNNAAIQPAAMTAARTVEIMDSDFALGKGMVTSVYTNATTTASNITGLSFAVLANRNYTMDCQIYYQGSVGTAGLDITLTGPAAATSIFYSYEEDATATTAQNSVAAAFGTKLVGNAAVTVTTNLPAHITMGLRNGANAGTVQVQGSATGAGTVTVQPGSACIIQ